MTDSCAFLEKKETLRTLDSDQNTRAETATTVNGAEAQSEERP